MRIMMFLLSHESFNVLCSGNLGINALLIAAEKALKVCFIVFHLNLTN